MHTGPPPHPHSPAAPGPAPQAAQAPLWATSAEGLDADTRPQELHGLGLHLRQCSAMHARLEALHCSLLRLRSWALGRRVSSLALLALLAGAALVLLSP